MLHDDDDDDDSILLAWLMSTIVRCSVQSVVPLPGISGIATNTDLIQSVGHSPVCRILLHSLHVLLSRFDFLSLAVLQEVHHIPWLCCLVIS